MSEVVSIFFRDVDAERVAAASERCGLSILSFSDYHIEGIPADVLIEAGVTDLEPVRAAILSELPHLACSALIRDIEEQGSSALGAFIKEIGTLTLIVAVYWTGGVCEWAVRRATTFETICAQIKSDVGWNPHGSSYPQVGFLYSRV